MGNDTVSRRDASARKRDQVRRAQRVMFLWVAIMAAVVGLSSVIAWFLWQQLVFRTEVVNKKSETASILTRNNAAVPDLKNNLRVLEVNQALVSAKANPDERALQVILDSLPSENNGLALGASVQQKLANDIQNLTIESLNTSVDTSSSLNSAGGSSNTVPFRMVVSSSDPNALKELLSRFERSIRVIDTDMLTLERASDRYTMTLEAHAYYEPPKSIDLRTETVLPAGSSKGQK